MTARPLLGCIGLVVLTACSYPGMDLGGKQCDEENRPCPEGYHCVPDANGGAVCRPESWDAGVICRTNEDCDDGNPCTRDSCLNHDCQNDPLTDGTACDDDLLCTEDDSCQAGVCNGAPVDCSGLDEVCVLGVCNPTTGQCQTQARPDQTPCDDGLVCTLVDECQAGECQSGTPKDCSHLDTECALGTCNPSTGQCQAQPANIGGSCGDPSGGPCDNPDSCDDQGGCQPNHLPASTRCVADDLVSCDGSGNVVESLTCPLGCNPDAAPLRCYRLNPSNIDDAARSAAGLDPLLCASTQPFDFGSAGDLCVKTDEAVNPFFDCALDQPVPDLQPAVINVISQDSAPEILVLSYSSINIPSDLNIFVRGNRVLVLLACGDATVAGQIWPNAPDRSAGPGGGTGGRSREDGSAWGTDGYGHNGPGTADDWPSPGGGGGGFGDVGGRGGNTANKSPTRVSGGEGGNAYANPELIPLIGGGGGGGGNDEALSDGGSTRGGYGGGGGGGLQISAGRQLIIEDGGGINAAGAGGQGAWGMGAGGGGGGAGGGILLEAAGMQLNGILAANGGGGGGGGTTGADNGDAGRLDAQPASGGSGQGSDGSSGGDGGAGTSASGQDGHLAGWDSGGGGGGGGRIRLNTGALETLTIDAQAIISPSDSPGPADADCTNLCTTGVVSIW